MAASYHESSFRSVRLIADELPLELRRQVYLSLEMLPLMDEADQKLFWRVIAFAYVSGRHNAVLETVTTRTVRS